MIVDRFCDACRFSHFRTERQRGDLDVVVVVVVVVVNVGMARVFAFHFLLRGLLI